MLSRFCFSLCVLLTKLFAAAIVLSKTKLRKKEICSLVGVRDKDSIAPLPQLRKERDVKLFVFCFDHHMDGSVSYLLAIEKRLKSKGSFSK